MKNREKLVKQLFVGKVSVILGFDKTLELLKEANDVFKKCEHNEDNDPKSNEATNPASCQTAVSGSAFSVHDLKCGNILNYDTAEGEILPTVIDWQDLKWLTEDPKGFNLDHSPIPLTEEWLLKFGFSDKDYKKGYIGKDFKSGGMIPDFVLSKPFSKGEWNNTYTFDFEGHRFSKIEFVHELQNFYYCLTGVMLSLS